MGAEIGGMKPRGWARLVLVRPDGARVPERLVFVRGYHAAGDPQGNPEVPVVRFWTCESGEAVERQVALEMPRVGLRRVVESVKGGAA